MKKLLLLMALALTVSLSSTAQTHRRHSQKATITATAKQDTAAITIYSDTTATANAADDSLNGVQQAINTVSKTYTFTDADDPFTLMAYLGSLGVGGVLIAICCVIFVIILFATPFIIVALIIYWLIHRKRTEYRIVEKAIDNGQPVPEGVLRKHADDREEIWRRGIKNVAIGVGVIIFGLFFTDFFVAVGAIFVCWGVGQCVIARTSASGKHPSADDDIYEDITQEKPSDTPEA